MEKLFSLKTRKLACLLMSVFVILILPGMSWLFSSQVGTSLQPDTAFFYNKEFLYELPPIYTAAGIKLYIWMHFTFDLVFPLVYGFFFLVFVLYFYRDKKSFTMALAVVFATVIFDYIENIGAMMVFSNYPLRLDFIATLTAVASSLKWTLFLVSILLLAFGVLNKYIFQRENLHS